MFHFFCSIQLTSHSIILVFSGIFTFLVDAYPLYAASALAANSFIRSSFAAAFPLFGPASESQSNAGFNIACKS